MEKININFDISSRLEAKQAWGISRDKIVDFHSRSRRSEYIWFSIGTFIFSCVASIVIAILSIIPILYVIGFIAFLLASIVLFVAGLSLSVRRLHDIGYSGWWLLASIIPLVGTVLWVVMLLADSQPGKNNWGPSPKGQCFSSILPTTH